MFDLIASDRYVCVLCGDVMDVKFETTHWYLCQISTAMVGPDLDRFLGVLFREAGESDLR